MYLGTFFFRNRPELALMARLCQRVASGGKPVRIAVVGCSNGAEVYSIAYTLRSTHPELGSSATGGYLFVSGVDLDVRTRVALDLGWEPVDDALEELHEGDPSLPEAWPARYYGLEPLDKKRPDWKVRYASVFKLP